jgi:phosphoglycolate phosphatase
MTRPRLALFDCDGTLADSQHEITSGMIAAFIRCGLAAPTPADIRTTIGLSLDRLVRHLAPSLEEDAQEELADTYREIYFERRSAAGSAPEPLYDGIADALDALRADGWLLGVATGKSQRGLIRLLTAHGLLDRFVTLQTADFHPSKPDPSMCRAAIEQAGVAAADTVVIGDTGYDMVMAVKAGARAMGVEWGYHPVAELRRTGAEAIADHPSALPALLNALLETAR